MIMIESFTDETITRSLTNWIGCLGFMEYQPFVGYLMPNPFLYK